MSLIFIKHRIRYIILLDVIILLWRFGILFCLMLLFCSGETCYVNAAVDNDYENLINVFVDTLPEL